ncbi:hypothetical protein [Rhizobium sp. OAE497]|uniref:hypothetical protein n=1 Tax=Rhizobium sp. OAE497 TaxID=2663796 RepID=UPI003395867F
MNSALFFIFGILIVALALGLRARRGKDMNLEQWTVGGRGFGAMIIFLLMAGEIYTTFVFLGRQWLCLWQGRAGLLHAGLWQPVLRAFLLAAAADLALCQGAQAHLAAGFLRSQV